MTRATAENPVAWLFPGQGSQIKGMGASLFEQFADLVAQADDVLGYSIAELCLHDPRKQLSRTLFAQPALYTVNALSFLAKIRTEPAPAFYAGHSLGEFNALFAAGCFDFISGLRLVKARAQLMDSANGGGMAAVIGVTPEQVQSWVESGGLGEKLEVANINSRRQVVISGDLDGIRSLAASVAGKTSARVVPLAVSAAFHSRHMKDAAASFEAVLRDVEFTGLRTPVLANVTGEFYPPSRVREILAQQICGAVRWRDGMLTLRRAGVRQVEQVGPGRALLDLWQEALQEEFPPASDEIARENGQVTRPRVGVGPRVLSPMKLGEVFCRRHGVAHPYVAGSMYRGIASARLVTKMAQAGFLSFFGAGGLDLQTVEDNLERIKREVSSGAPFGMNLLATPERPELERAVAELYIRHGIRYVEASGFTQVTPDIVAYRFKNATSESGRAFAPNKVFAKVSRSEVASEFLRPPSEKILRSLLETGRLTSREAEMARRLPVSAEICFEADSGGHTDRGIMLTMLPSAVRLRDQIQQPLGLDETTAIGAAGGIGTPAAIAACFVLGAEFVLCGSIHQCTPEAGTSDAVKDMLCHAGLNDTGYAPAGDLFTTGAKVQVLKRGTLFAARANYLYDTYRFYGGLRELPEQVCGTVERYLGAPWETVWKECQARLRATRPRELERIEGDEKAKMARVFKTYFSRTIETALEGDVRDKVNWQIHCGSSMGAFNAFAATIKMEDWRDRSVDRVAHELISSAEHSYSSATGWDCPGIGAKIGLAHG